MEAERYVCYQEANAVVVEVHGVDVSCRDSSDSIYDNVIFVNGGGREAERAVRLDAIECAASVL